MNSTVRNLILVRHGPTAYTLEGRICGRHDPDLTQDGFRAAQSIARHPGLSGLDLLVASPSRRALQTAEAIAHQLNVSISVDCRLREIDFGIWEGVEKDKLESNSEYVRWHKDPFQISPPGGESGLIVQRRLIEALLEHMDVGRHVVFVTHKGAIRLILGYFANATKSGFVHTPSLKTASVTRVSISGATARILEVGDTSHLEDDLDLGVY
jgi:broad specificity phosphatase PhoE